MRGERPANPSASLRLLPPDEFAPVAELILPDGCPTLDAAADRFLGNLAPADLLTFDQGIQKDTKKRHASARELRLELKELLEPGGDGDAQDDDERSFVENVPGLDDPASVILHLERDYCQRSAR